MKIYDFEGKKNISGPQIKRLRKGLKITKDELAGLLREMGIFIERDSMSRIDIGTRFVADYELRALAEIFGCEVKDLLP